MYLYIICIYIYMNKFIVVLPSVHLHKACPDKAGCRNTGPASEPVSPPPAGQWEHAAKEDHQKMAKHEMDLDNRGSLQPLRKAGDTPCCQSHAWNIAPGSDSRSNKNESHKPGPVQCTGVRDQPSTQKKSLNPSPRGARCASNKVGAPPLQHLH